MYCSDWSNRISHDQMAINDYIVPKAKDKIIVFMGIGNSELAIRCNAAKRIHGFSFGNRKEMIVAHDLELHNYIFTEQSKYTLGQDYYPRHVDFISDNNPFFVAINQLEIEQLMKCYSYWLKPTGEFVTHKKGIIWSYTKSIANVELDENQNFTLNQCKKFTEKYFNWEEKNDLIILRNK